jgi:hypothetical protein
MSLEEDPETLPVSDASQLGPYDLGGVLVGEVT